ncbi:hypothetical protein [Wolbachia endosymbiont (group B) of Limnophora tigrina]
MIPYWWQLLPNYNVCTAVCHATGMTGKERTAILKRKEIEHDRMANI